MIYFNANSLLQRRDEITQFMLKNNVMLACFSETFLKSHINFNLTGYTIIRADEPDDRHGGGVAIAIKSNISFREFTLPKFRTIPSTCAIKIKCQDGSDVLVVSLYVPNHVKKICKNELAQLMHLCGKVVVAGDWNARHLSWNCTSSNAKGVTLLEYLNSNNASSVSLHFPETPTFYPRNFANQPSTIDLCLTKGVNVRNKPESRAVSDSDHNPILIDIQLNGPPLLSPGGEKDYSKADWVQFREILDNHLASSDANFHTAEEIEIAACSLSKAITRAEEAAVPLRKPVMQVLSPEIRDLISFKNRLRRILQRPSTPLSEKEHLRIEINKLRSTIKAAISRSANVKTALQLRRLKPHDTGLYKHVNKITKQKVMIPPLKCGDATVFHSELKAKLLADCFERVHHQNDAMGKPDHEAEVNATVADFLSRNQQFPDVLAPSGDDVKKVIESLKVKKAPGRDGISNVAVKNISTAAMMYLVSIITAMFRLGYFPKLWRRAKVLAFPKPGKDPTKPENYRPISLLPCLGKVVEKLLVMRLWEELKSKGLIQPEQFGFQAGCSTAHALLTMKTEIERALEAKCCTATAFLDIEKAFDTVWHQGLIFKMIKARFSPWLIKMIHSYLLQRTFSVSLGSSYSDDRHAGSGVPQGSVLGPVLFLFYIHDLPRHPYTNLTIFADDTSIRSTHARADVATRHLQEHLDLLARFYDKWRIKINATKSENVLFTRRRRFTSDEPSQLRLNGSIIQRKSQVKYLGVTFQKNLRFNQHCQVILAKTKQTLSKLWCLMGPQSCLNTTNKVTIFKLFLRSGLTCNIHVWDDLCASKMDKL